MLQSHRCPLLELPPPSPPPPGALQIEKKGLGSWDVTPRCQGAFIPHPAGCVSSAPSDLSVASCGPKGVSEALWCVRVCVCVCWGGWGWGDRGSRPCMFCPPPQQNKVPINRYQVRADKEAGREDRHGGLQVSLAPLLRHSPGLPLWPPEGPQQFRLRYPGSRGHAGAWGHTEQRGEALGWGQGVRHRDERTEVPWGTVGHSTLLEDRQPGR